MTETMALLGLMAALKERIMIFTLLWLGGIVLCATPYLWALYRAARDAARTTPVRREPPLRLAASVTEDKAP
ncbi:hypothetical protein [Inquilinus sp. Marseille-Q2685]|uniref:hypothetical protein n=1 Tax=Inquilinus sp. Marseille-Q2685 TaxID=2866581 RepID=UPI001CE41572|nr:hypothetical protein [Inquilinus sp. Marseille-Q2685]